MDLKNKDLSQLKQVLAKKLATYEQIEKAMIDRLLQDKRLTREQIEKLPSEYIEPLYAWVTEAE